MVPSLNVFTDIMRSSPKLNMSLPCSNNGKKLIQFKFWRGDSLLETVKIRGEIISHNKNIQHIYAKLGNAQ